MQHLSIRKFSELAPAAQDAVEAILGRELADDEEVGVWASRPGNAPAGDARKAAWDRLSKHLGQMGAKSEAATADELDLLADEVTQDVRHGRR